MNSTNGPGAMRKFWVSAMFGIVCLLMSPYGLVANLGEIRIDIPWALFLPILASMAYGWQYGLVAGLAGGAFFPFLLWANNGYANLLTAFTYLCIYALIGLPADAGFFVKVKKLYIRYILCIGVCTFVFYFYFLILFQPLLNLNPAFWVSKTINNIPRDFLYDFAFKDVVNLILLSLISEASMRLPFIRKVLGLSKEPSFQANNLIFIKSIISSIVMWLTYIGLGIVLFEGDNVLRHEHISLALLVMVSSGFFIARILFYYNEKQYSILYQLNYSEEKYRNIFENMHDIYFRIDLEGTILEISPSIEHFSGLRVEEIIGRSFDQLCFNPDDGRTLINSIKKDNVLNDYEIKLKTVKGKVKFASLNTRLIQDGVGLPQYAEGIMRDITDRKKASEMFDNERILLRTLIDNIPDAIYLKDLECRKTLVNPAEVRYMGAKSENEVLGRTDFELYPEDLAEQFYTDDQMVMRTGEALLNREEFIIDENGDRRYLLSSKIPIRDKNNVVIGLVGIGRDISKRKKIEENFILAKEKAEESEQRLVTFINSIPDIICYKDYCGRWMLANNADLELFGLKNVDYVGKTDAELAPFTLQIYEEAFKSCMVSDEKAWINGTITRGTENIPTPEGIQKCYDILKIPVFHPNGDRKGLAVIGRDITEFIAIQNELEIAKERAEGSNHLKTTFLSNISHEIRTPFNSLLGFLNLITDNELTDLERTEYVGLINQSSYRLMNTINDIVEISQIQTGQVEVLFNQTNLQQLIDSLYQRFRLDAEKKKLKFTITNQLPIQMDCLVTDEKKLNVILINIIGNAIKFTESGSVDVAFRLEKKVNNENNINSSELSGVPTRLLFSVKDTGIGIPKEKQSQVFGLFMQGDGSHTRSFEGCGLGLSISKAYVEMLGGEIWIESHIIDNSETKGTIFYFTIPYIGPTEQKLIIGNREVAKGTVANLKNLIVLIAEDDETSAMLISISVKAISKQVIKVKTGLDAVEACRKNPDIDLILMDIKMPGLNGYEATQQIRQFNTKVTIIAQTANALFGDREKALAAGCDGYIEKPIIKEKLISLINGHLKN